MAAALNRAMSKGASTQSFKEPQEDKWRDLLPLDCFNMFGVGLWAVVKTTGARLDFLA